MKQKNRCLGTHFSTILWSTLAILLCAAPALHADDVFVPAGETWNIDYPVTGTLYIDGTANLLTGASVSQSIYVQTGGILNMFSGTIGGENWFISVSPGASTTVYGTNFAVSNGTIEPHGDWNPYGIGTLTGYYEDTSSINLSFYTDIPIHLQPPPSGGPEEIIIDIKPGSYPNSINLKSKGVVPVAVLTTAQFDAITVDPATVEFAEASPLRWTLEDVDNDGDVDMLFHFKTQELNLDEDSTEAVLTGQTNDGDDIAGTDDLRIVPQKSKKK